MHLARCVLPQLPQRSLNARARVRTCRTCRATCRPASTETSPAGIPASVPPCDPADPARPVHPTRPATSTDAAPPLPRSARQSSAPRPPPALSPSHRPGPGPAGRRSSESSEPRRGWSWGWGEGASGRAGDGLGQAPRMVGGRLPAARASAGAGQMLPRGRVGPGGARIGGAGRRSRAQRPLAEATCRRRVTHAARYRSRPATARREQSRICCVTLVNPTNTTTISPSVTSPPPHHHHHWPPHPLSRPFCPF
jgi:hypothetical protein